MMPISLPPLDIDQVVKKIGKLPSPSAVIVELLRVIDDDNIGSSALAKIISRDQAIVVRMLRVANSSFYGLPGKVETVGDAIAVLGLRTVRTMAAGAAISGGFGFVVVGEFEVGKFWRHSITTAVGARLLARRLKLGEGAAFVAGLIHDVGQLMLASSFPEHAQAVARYVAAHVASLAAAELQILGMDHARIGGILAERWHFPAAICAAIAYHHTPESLPPASLPHAVYLASELALAIDLPVNSEERLQIIAQLNWGEISLPRQDLLEILGQIEREAVPLCEALVD